MVWLIDVILIHFGQQWSYTGNTWRINSMLFSCHFMGFVDHSKNKQYHQKKKVSFCYLYQNSGIKTKKKKKTCSHLRPKWMRINEQVGWRDRVKVSYLQYKWMYMYISVSFYSLFIKRNHFTAGCEGGGGSRLIVETVILHLSELCQCWPPSSTPFSSSLSLCFFLHIFLPQPSSLSLLPPPGAAWNPSYLFSFLWTK